MATTRPEHSAFTLVELLVVIGIIAVLIGILLPALSRARQSANFVACKSNLSQIAQATRMYANDNHDHYPDLYTAGGAYFRRGYGETDPLDPTSIPEVYGLPSLYGMLHYLPLKSPVWICPSQTEEIKSFKNTYVCLTSLPTASTVNWTSVQRGAAGNNGSQDHSDQFWIYEDTANKPFITGYRRGPADTNPLYPTNAKMPYPHPYRSKSARAINVLYVDGSVGAIIYYPNGTSETVHGG